MVHRTRAPILALALALALGMVLAPACSGDEESASNPPSVGGTGAGGTTAPVGSGGSDASGSGGAATTGAGAGSSSGGEGIAAQFPGDVGIEGHPSVVWVENFEEGSVEAVVARYDDHKNQAGMALDGDVPAASSGAASMRMTAGGGTSATDLFKSFGEGYDELYARYYVKYADGVDWHHTGVWVGGYNPPTSWPNPQAGTRPDGDDRFSVAIEPMGGGTNPRLDSYNYWMGMQTNPGGGFWGNNVIHSAALFATHGWQCLEIHIRMNPAPGSAAGAELGFWLEDVAIVRYDDQGPPGRWLHDNFCRDDADATSCTDYDIPPPTTVLDLQWRTTNDLKINHFWPQNYITGGTPGDVWYDDMVLATERVGCIAPN